MGLMDDLKAMGLPVPEGAFSYSKLPLLGKGALSKILNVLRTLILRGNQILAFEAPNIVAAGDTNINVTINGADWDTDPSLWEIWISGPPGSDTGPATLTITSITNYPSADECGLRVDYGAVGIGAGMTVPVIIWGVRAGGSEKELVGSVSMVTV